LKGVTFSKAHHFGYQNVCLVLVYIPPQSPMIYGSPPTKNNHTSLLNILNAEAGGDLPAPKGDFFRVSTYKLPGRPLKLLTGECFLSFFSKGCHDETTGSGCGFKYFLFSPLPGEMIQFD